MTLDLWSRASYLSLAIYNHIIVCWKVPAGKLWLAHYVRLWFPDKAQMLLERNRKKKRLISQRERGIYCSKKLWCFLFRNERNSPKIARNPEQWRTKLQFMTWTAPIGYCKCWISPRNWTSRAIFHFPGRRYNSETLSKRYKTSKIFKVSTSKHVSHHIYCLIVRLIFSYCLISNPSNIWALRVAVHHWIGRCEIELNCGLCV